ncbi:MAG: 50S ribosomal protein L30e [Candidatus Saliniplasma sp.]
MDINREIRLAVNTGETSLGIKEAIKNAEEGQIKMLIVAKNCPEPQFKEKEYDGVPIYHFNGNNHELGSTAGKPFTVSTIAVMDPGESDILSLVK